MSIYKKIIPTPSTQLLDIIVPHIFSLGTYGNARQRVVTNRKRWENIFDAIWKLIHGPIELRLPMYLLKDLNIHHKCFERCQRIEMYFDFIGRRIPPRHINQVHLYARVWNSIGILFQTHRNDIIPRSGVNALSAYLHAACRETETLLMQQARGPMRQQITVHRATRAWVRSDIPPWLPFTSLGKLLNSC